MEHFGETDWLLFCLTMTYKWEHVSLLPSSVLHPGIGCLPPTYSVNLQCGPHASGTNALPYHLPTLFLCFAEASRTSSFPSLAGFSVPLVLTHKEEDFCLLFLA